MLLKAVLFAYSQGIVILDRLVHHAHRITLTGGSLRRLATPDLADSTAD